MRKKILFLTAGMDPAEGSEGRSRSAKILGILLQKYEVDLIFYGEPGAQCGWSGNSALTVHSVKRKGAPGRTMLRSLYKLPNDSYVGKADKELSDLLKKLCANISYSHVFIAHSLAESCMNVVRQCLPEAVLIMDGYRAQSVPVSMKVSRKRGLVRPYHRLSEAMVRGEERRLLRKTRLLLAHSEWAALGYKALSFADAGKVHVVPDFLDLSQYPRQGCIHKENQIVLYLDLATDQGKNAAVAFFHKSYPLIKARVPDVKCWLLSAAVHPELERLVKEEDSVISLIIRWRCCKNPSWAPSSRSGPMTLC
ncbi:hypothetical protein J7E73_15480 [Paenibacillus albidus]|uniref:hypothetical protein n=1 Tax=Paenibacillus albidus TaxID=2041023 RepID=UPI001BED2A45|nr:hypothetical protein [Paenibacillus albidus]MBT2290508.1 hypothetical protein [Paenibacillus albidus]